MLTPYAKQLLAYVEQHKGTDAERYLDTYIPKWRNLTCQPTSTVSITTTTDEEE